MNINKLRIIIIAAVLVHTTQGHSQYIPQMKLKTSEFKPSTFTPSRYTPIQSDPTILQRSFEKREQRANKAHQAFLDLIDLCNELKSQMPSSERDWFNSYTDSICDDIEEQIRLENYQTAHRLSISSKSELLNNPKVQYRIDSYKQYCDDMQNHGLYNYQNGRVTQIAYEWFCIQNQYKFMPKYDDMGEIIGYNPIKVSYLYPSINWQEVYQYMTSQSRTRDNIEHLWTLYFNYNPDKLSSLHQEFNVAKFCLEYWMSNYNNPNISQLEKEQLQKDINAYRAILSNSDGEISYNAFVENLKNQYIVQPSVKPQKSSTRKQTAKRRNSRSTKK